MFTASNYDNRSKLRLVSFCVVFIFWSLFEANKLLQRKNVEMPRKNAKVPWKNAEMQPRNTEMPLKKTPKCRQGHREIASVAENVAKGREVLHLLRNLILESKESSGRKEGNWQDTFSLE